MLGAHGYTSWQKSRMRLARRTSQEGARKDESRSGDKGRTNQPHIIAIMTTEHYNPQSGRAMTISDSAGRSSLFLSSVSITLVALAFVGQYSQLETAFYLFALVPPPSLFFIGLVTFERVLQSAIKDFILARGVNRLRHFHLELASAIQDYFILSTHDDEQSAFLNTGLRRSPSQVLLTTPGMIALIDSVLAGAFAGLLVSYLVALISPCMAW
jgi:hypothetical protein